MPFAVARDGARIHYEVTEPPASAPARGDVVLLQGLGLSSRFWFDMPERLASDPRGPWRVVVVDNRGTGRSDRPRGPYRITRMADDVAACLDAANVARADVVGISMGGMIAQEVALRHPARTSGLVLLATTPGLPHGRPPRPRALASLVGLALTKPGVPARALPRLLLPASQLHRARELFARWPGAMRAHPVTPRAFLAQLAAAAAHTTGFALHRIRCPTVVVTGADDVLVPPANSRVLAACIPGAHLEVLPGVAHGIPLLDEDVVARALAGLRERKRTAV